MSVTGNEKLVEQTKVELTGNRLTVELKGNSDETWSRGLSYLLENRIFPDKPGG